MLHISYSGEEAFDLILITARIITKLGHRILIIDLSDTGALKKAINHGMDLDSSEHIVNYRDINYTRKIPTDDEMSDFGPCVCIFNFGYKLPKMLYCRFDANIVVLNTYPHVIEKANVMMEGKEYDPEKLSIVIRDIIRVDDVERVKNEITFPHKDSNESYLYHDAADYENSIRVMTKQVVDFSGISASMEKYIIHFIQSNFSDHSIHEIKRAFNSAKKGR